MGAGRRAAQDTAGTTGAALGAIVSANATAVTLNVTGATAEGAYTRQACLRLSAAPTRAPTALLAPSPPPARLKPTHPEQ